MPAIPYRKGRKSLYPDTSTLIYAFRGAKTNATADEKALLGVLREVAASANLCLSVTHLLELVRGNFKDLLEEARLLDTLDIVWLIRHDRAGRLEVRNLLRGTVAGVVARPDIPWVPSFLSQFQEIRPDATPEFLGRSTLVSFLAEAAGDPSHLRRVEEFAALGKSMSQRFFVDRNRGRREGVTDEELVTRLDAQLRAHLLQMAEEVHDELVAAADWQYVERYGSVLRIPDRTWFREILPIPERAPMLLPTFFAFHRVIRNAAKLAAQKEHVGTRYFKERSGDPFD